MDLFQNDVTKRLGHVTKRHCWQKSWQAYCLRTILRAKMDSIRTMLNLESAASEVELLEALKQLTVKLLKDLCREKSLKL